MNEENGIGLIARIKAKIKSYLVSNWAEVMKHAWSIWAAAAGLITPELIQVLADNITMFPWFDDSHKNVIRVVCLLLVVVLRPIDQKKVSDL